MSARAVVFRGTHGNHGMHSADVLCDCVLLCPADTSTRWLRKTRPCHARLRVDGCASVRSGSCKATSRRTSTARLATSCSSGVRRCRTCYCAFCRCGHWHTRHCRISRYYVTAGTSVHAHRLGCAVVYLRVVLLAPRWLVQGMNELLAVIVMLLFTEPQLWSAACDSNSYQVRSLVHRVFAAQPSWTMCHAARRLVWRVWSPRCETLVTWNTTRT